MQLTTCHDQLHLVKILLRGCQLMVCYQPVSISFVFQFSCFVFENESESEVAQSIIRVQLFATPWTVAYQAPPSMGFSRQEYWSGLPFSFSRGSSEPRDRMSPAFQVNVLTSEPPGKQWGVVYYTLYNNVYVKNTKMNQYMYGNNWWRISPPTNSIVSQLSSKRSKNEV